MNIIAINLVCEEKRRLKNKDVAQIARHKIVDRINRFKQREKIVNIDCVNQNKIYEITNIKVVVA